MFNYVTQTVYVMFYNLFNTTFIYKYFVDKIITTINVLLSFNDQL